MEADTREEQVQRAVRRIMTVKDDLVKGADSVVKGVDTIVTQVGVAIEEVDHAFDPVKDAFAKAAHNTERTVHHVVEKAEEIKKKIEPAPAPKFRQRRRVRDKVTFTEGVDGCVEKGLLKTGELPCCRVCRPPKLEGKKHDDDDAARNLQGAGGLAGVNFGYPAFDHETYVLEEDDHDVFDPLVPNELGLEVLIHRKTTTNRYRLTLDKSDLPSTQTVGEIQTRIRLLKRSDHVNILKLLEVFEDDHSLYLVYEYFPCVTLKSCLQDQSWSQEEIVNIVRECCSAVAYGFSISLTHLSFALSDILLPASAKHRGGDTDVLKVFGFGFMGCFKEDVKDKMFWSPEALEKQAGNPQTWCQKMEHGVRGACDSWSLGVLTFALLMRRLPFTTEADILSKNWSFTMDIDAWDAEAKKFVECLLDGDEKSRLRADRALHHAWIRRRWRPKYNSQVVFTKLLAFVESPLPVRLLGRYLVKFLDANDFRKIAKWFYALDMQGNGVVAIKELWSTAKQAGHAGEAASTIFEWLVPEGTSLLPLNRFAEAFAEEVIDGSALRQAFESLDDDGSESLNAEELYEKLRELSDDLVLDDVMTYIRVVTGAGDDSAQDLTIDYSFFLQLFPVRTQRLEAVQARKDSTKVAVSSLRSRFGSTQEPVLTWMSEVERLVEHIKSQRNGFLKPDTSERASRTLQKLLKRADHLLHNPPGAGVNDRVLRKAQKKHKKEKLVQGFDFDEDGLMSVDTFLQDQSIEDHWHSMLHQELSILKALVEMTHMGEVAQGEYFKALEAAETASRKLEDVNKKAKGQFDEYEALLDCMDDREPAVKLTGLAGRGLRVRYYDDYDSWFVNPLDLAGPSNNSVFKRIMRGLRSACGRA